MRLRRFEWEGAEDTAVRMRGWVSELSGAVDVGGIFADVVAGGDSAVLELTNRLDSTAKKLDSLRVDRAEAESALAALASEVRDALELAAANVREVAVAQLPPARRVELPQGHNVELRSVPVGAAGIYAPGGRAAYPSSVIMCAVPARAAGVGRLALASPPGAEGRVHPLVLAAAALCEIDEIYAMGGAQAIYALAYGTESVPRVEAIVGPGNAWVREAKRSVAGVAAIDSLAGPSELMVVAGHDSDPEWAALDLCAQAEHGGDNPLAVVAAEEHVLEAIAAATETAAAEHRGVGDAPMALVHVPDMGAAIDLANAYAPEHLELLEEDAVRQSSRVRTAGCVFAGRFSATAFGDYAAGSNHVLPTGGAGRFSGPLGPDVFLRAIATVEVSEEAASKLAPSVDILARAEGFPVHGESAMIRSRRYRR